MATIPTSVFYFRDRNIGRDIDTLRVAVKGRSAFRFGDETIAATASTQAAADGSINDDPALRFFDEELARDHLRLQISHIARARIASVMKTIGFQHVQTDGSAIGNACYGAVAKQIARRAKRGHRRFFSLGELIVSSRAFELLREMSK
ncbi:hypothetical protein I6F33_11190 [Bradyrhizobium sp. BRP20]|uniref:hypothetical protein n=1 Tax=Bradyrhizobium sp. BRP20 TaxID=2793822 RepID=UPI001CD49AD0|nr:hypothetical protein [Bradyrhizobium sp. BRP20]MCA1433540.1 hypothetical protein [Bradyrhizobium sp. BRP20]